MFWIALELSNLMIGLITRLSLLAKNLTAFKFGKVAKSGNAGDNRERFKIGLQCCQIPLLVSPKRG